MKTRIFSLFLTVFASATLWAQNKGAVTGMVTDQQGEPMVGVRVLVKGTVNGTVSDEKGYQLKDVSYGEQTIIFSAVGYAEKREKIVVDKNEVKLSVTLAELDKRLEEVIVTGVRATDKTPTTFSTLTEQEIKAQNYGQDLPILLNQLPSTVVTSDAGAGVGYTAVRIRGIDPTRTNVTVNGIPINDAESHTVFYVNMPDFSASAGGVQVQRGLGTSTNGAAAFGASINIATNDMPDKPYVELDNTVGSFKTFKNSIRVGTGKMNNGFFADARLSRISSDGFIDRGSSLLKSFYVSTGWQGKKSLIKAIVFGGSERTYQAWNGVPEAKFKNDSIGLWQHYYNNGYDTEDSLNLFDSDPNRYNAYLYKNETDNYKQEHYHLYFVHEFNNKWNMSISGHLTRGKGYYEQYKKNQKMSNYGMEPVIIGSEIINRTDLIRQRWLDNYFYGTVFTVNYRPMDNLHFLLGGAVNNYQGKHFGEVIWARYASNTENGHRYYDNDAQKFEANGYLKTTYSYKWFDFFADLQLRHINYSYLGLHLSFGEIVELQQRSTYLFFNPKVGLTYSPNIHHAVYASYSRGSREPVRKDFTESTSDSKPKAEHLGDLEVGYRMKYRKVQVNSTIYWMDFTDELVLTGKINDVGAYTRTNVDKSYRLGWELDGAVAVHKTFTISANLALSMNKIKEYTEYVDNYDDGSQAEINYKNVTTAFSPSVIAGLGLHYEPVRNLKINWYAKYVGKQYLDNTASNDRKLDAFFVNNASISYTLENIVGKELLFGIQVNNVLNQKYASNGYTWGYIYGGERINENFLFPQAGIHFMGRIAIKF